MAFAQTSTLMLMKAQSAFSGVWNSLQGLLGYSQYSDFSPEEVLAKTPNIDPRFIAKAPMSNENLDVYTLAELGKMGLRRGKEITNQTHPELYQAFAEMSARAGLEHTPQLILVESNTVNAFTVPPQEMVVTTGFLKALNLREARAVLGHELGHGISDHSRPRVIATRGLQAAGIVIGNVFAHHGGFGRLMDHEVPNPGLLRRMGTWIFGHGDKPLSVLASALSMLVGASIGSVVANQFTVGPTELDADLKGVHISGDPEGFASAMKKLEQTRGGAPLLRAYSLLVSGYPSTETRIRRLSTIAQTMPAPPPAAPVAEVAPIPVAATGSSPTALITGAALAEQRVSAMDAPAMANG